MAYLSRFFNKHVLTTALVVLTITLLIMPFATSNDYAEAVWGVLEELEPWQADEIMLALFVGLVSGLIVALIQIASLSKQIEQLNVAAQHNQSVGSDTSTQSAYVMKCALCSKYQFGENQWLKEADYISKRLHTKVMAGICPDCDK